MLALRLEQAYADDVLLGQVLYKFFRRGVRTREDRQCFEEFVQLKMKASGQMEHAQYDVAGLGRNPKSFSNSLLLTRERRTGTGYEPLNFFVNFETFNHCGQEWWAREKNKMKLRVDSFDLVREKDDDLSRNCCRMIGIWSSVSGFCRTVYILVSLRG